MTGGLGPRGGSTGFRSGLGIADDTYDLTIETPRITGERRSVDGLLLEDEREGTGQIGSGIGAIIVGETRLEQTSRSRPVTRGDRCVAVVALELLTRCRSSPDHRERYDREKGSKQPDSIEAGHCACLTGR